MKTTGKALTGKALEDRNKAIMDILLEAAKERELYSRDYRRFNCESNILESKVP